MRRQGTYTRLLVVTAAIALTGCATRSTVVSLPLTAGISARYDVPTDSVAATVSRALEGLGFHRVDLAGFDSVSGMMVGRRGMSLLSSGEYARVLVREMGTNVTDITVTSQSVDLLDWSGRAERYPPQIIRSVDTELGPDHILPLPSARVRGRTEPGSDLVEGEAHPADSVVWMFHPDADILPEMPLSSLIDREVLRGTFHHASEGRAIGGILGLLLGVSWAETYEEFFLSVLGGHLVGTVIGSLLRSEVWSPGPRLGPSRGSR